MYSADEIIAQLKHVTNADKELIKRAYSRALDAHKDFKRLSGKPYMSHPAAVGYKLAVMGMEPRTICSGLLHDVIEDTPVKAEDVEKEFGEEILFLVEGVTKLSSVRYYGTDRHNESLRKLFIATSQDIRVLIIKLVDRLHNMETLSYLPPEKQSRIAKETLQIYSPIAHRLGMGKIRKELEDLAFPYVYPKEAKFVADSLQKKYGNAKEILERERKVLQKKLADLKMFNFKTSYRVKGMYSLYNKLKRKEWNIDLVYDLMAMRVVVENVDDCYRTLGIVHELWRPLPQRIKDYIAFPKPNGYQSIHTTIATRNGVILEIQIRTKKMHQEAEFGVASHVLYKEPTINKLQAKTFSFSSLIPSLFKPFSNRETGLEKKVEESDAETPHKKKIPRWISEIGQMYHKDSENPTSDFVEDGESDFFENRIFVFTPTGDVVDLPLGATPIDFSYAIHSEVGDHTSGAWVNRKLVSLETELKNGDIVKIETKKSAKPSPKWLDFAKTSLARKKIKSAIETEK